MVGRALLAAIACFLTSWFSSSTARAATALPGVALETERSGGAEGCPNAEALTLRILMLGIPKQEASQPLSVHVAFQRVEADFFATVRTSGRFSGTRELSAAGPTCDPLAAATAVLLALLLDLRPHETQAPEAMNAPAEPPAATGEEHPFRYVAVHVRLDAAYGVLGPAFGLAYGGNARLRLTRFELVLGGFAFVERSVELSPGSVEVGLAGANFDICASVARSGAIDLGACASFLFGRFHGSGHGFYADEDDASPWLAGGLGATLAFELSRHWAVRLSLGMLVPFRRYNPEVDGVGVAYYSPPIAGVFGFGPEFRFP
jgi:hypothetical protein